MDIDIVVIQTPWFFIYKMHDITKNFIDMVSEKDIEKYVNCVSLQICVIIYVRKSML